MVHCWRCRHCSFTVWSASRSETIEAVQSHLLKHHRQQIAKQDFELRWECPYCDSSGQTHDETEGIQRFKQHVFQHVKPLMEQGTHVANEIDGTGSVLVRAPPNSKGANNARVHFHSLSDIVMFVTTAPAKRIQLLDERLDAWPAWTILLTTKANPLAGIDGIEIGSIPIEVVQLNSKLGLRQLGETISRVLKEQDTTQGKLSVEFDILSEIIDKFEMQTVFRFLHLLNERFERSDALSHYYVDGARQSASTLNILDEVFDITITADGNNFIAEPHPAQK